MVISKTELGAQVMKDRSVALTPRQRSALILCDGKRTLEQVMVATSAIGVTKDDMSFLFDLGLVVEGAGAAHLDTQPVAMPPAPAAAAAAAAAAPVSAPAPAAAPPSDRSPQQRYMEAYPLATKLTSSLGFRGFRLNLAVEAAGNYQDLVALLPKIKEAAGADKCGPLERALLS